MELVRGIRRSLNYSTVLTARVLFLVILNLPQLTATSDDLTQSKTQRRETSHLTAKKRA